MVQIEVRAGRLAPPAGEIRDPLLSSPASLVPGRRRTRVRIRVRFARRGRRALPPTEVLVRDPLGLAEHPMRVRAAADEVLVLPRIHPVELPAGGGDAAGGGRGRAVAGAEVDLDGLRAHRPGAPASRIAWQVYSRTGELHERALNAEADSRPLVVLDLRGAPPEADADAAVRAAASLVVHLAARGGCALLLPGDRRPVQIDPALRAWPAAHARLAVTEAGHGPTAAGLAGRRGAVIWVLARASGDTPRALLRSGGAARVLVVPGTLPGRRPAFRVAGCTGYDLGRTRRPAGAPAPAGAATGAGA
jgi:uncharacterized protein (DUF58 family)